MPPFEMAPERGAAWVLSEGPTASSDYYLFPHLASQGYRAVVWDSRCAPGLWLEQAGDCGLLVISRYLPRHCWGAVQQLRRRGVPLVYFMDDDLWDAAAWQGLPWPYRWKIASQAWVFRAWLARCCEAVWVSTEYLAAKYAQCRPLLLNPQPAAAGGERAKPVSVCYHGSASHAQELAWLAPVVEAVQAQAPQVHFELFGTRAVARRFGRMPRVKLLFPMDWPNYLAFTSTQTRDIALAPLLPGKFNAARGPTKFFDYTRMGAAGIYSDVAPYRGFVRDGVDGVLLGNEPALWVEALLRLAEDNAGRESLAVAAKQRVLAMDSPR